MSAEVTLPRLLRRNADTIPNRAALREKRRGIWQTLTWRAYWQAVHRFASGLAAMGFRRGDKLSVIGDNRPRLYAAQLAAQCLGGIAVPVYHDEEGRKLADARPGYVEAELGKGSPDDIALLVYTSGHHRPVEGGHAVAREPHRQR